MSEGKGEHYGNFLKGITEAACSLKGSGSSRMKIVVDRYC